MSLTESVDYVFYPKVQVLESRMTAKMSDACLLGTKRFIFIVPIRSIQSLLVATRVTNYDGDPAAAVAQLVSQPDLTVDALEQQMIANLGEDKETRIFDLESVETFAMKTGFLGQTKIKMPGDKVKLINIKGKGNKGDAKAFYADRL